jgi:ribosome-associated protein
MTDEDQVDDLPPSKSARKRAAHAAQDLGEALIGLPDAELEAIGLPERLRDAIALARTITSRAGLARQRQYIGKLMRDLDLAPIEAALAARQEAGSREAQSFRRVELWRERLMNEGEAGLEALATQFPQLDRASLRDQVTAARHERAQPSAAASGAYRELFRMLRALLAPGAK